MNHLVFLDPTAGELEKILSGIKCMLVKASDPGSVAYAVSPGDILYFLRTKDESDLRVAATVVRVLWITGDLGEGVAQVLKEQQPRLQLTEDQYHAWAAKTQVLLVEFESAHKIEVVHIAPAGGMNQADWIAFDDFSLITR